MKPAGANRLTDNEGQEETNKEDDGQTSKPADKKPVATGHHLDPKMVQLVTTSMFSTRVKRPSIPRTTFLFIAFRDLAGYFSRVLSICSKIARRCQTSTSHTSDILPLWGAYVDYPLPTEQGTCAMATGISEKTGGPHVEDSLSPWTQTKPPSLSHLCLYCNISHNSRGPINGGLSKDIS